MPSLEVYQISLFGITPSSLAVTSFATIGIYSLVTELFPSEIDNRTLADCVPLKNSADKFSPEAVIDIVPFATSDSKFTIGISINDTARVWVYTALIDTALCHTFASFAITSFGDTSKSRVMRLISSAYFIVAFPSS